MCERRKEEPDDLGVTIISSIPRDPEGFHKRLLLAGLRLSVGPAKIGVFTPAEGPTISAVGSGCTGYLLASDGMEASESDLLGFLSGELEEGEGINILGRYAPDPDRTVQSRAHFRRIDGRIMCAEERLILHADGTVEPLLRRSEIRDGNVVPLEGMKVTPPSACGGEAQESNVVAFTARDPEPDPSS